MKLRVYITDDTFSALVSFLQKGIDVNLKFLIYDLQNLIQNRLWTFSSTTFIPNVKLGDEILKDNEVPIIISSNQANHCSLNGYEVILYESYIGSYKDFQNISTIFMQNKKDVKKILEETNTNEKSCDIYFKDGKKWEKITSLQP